MRRILACGLVGSLLVLCGGLLRARVPSSSWVATWPALSRLRAGPASGAPAWELFAAGLVLLTAAWWALGRRVRGRADGATRVLEAVAVWVLPLLVGPPLFSNDAWSYVADGYLAGHGLSPYVVPVAVLHGPLVALVSPMWRHTLTPYGPVTLLWGAWSSHLTSNPWLLMLAQRGLAVVGLVLLGFAVPRLARYAGHDPAAATWLAVASPFVLVSGIADLHNDLVMAGLMAVALLAACRRAWVLGAVLGGLATAVKLPGAGIEVGVILLSLPVGASVVTRLGRILSVGALAVGTVVVVGWLGGLGVGWVGALGVPLVRRSPLSPTTDLGRLSHALLPEETIARELQAVRALGVVVLAVLVLVLLLRRPTGVTPRTFRAVALVMLAVTVLSPVIRPWYFLWCVPMLGVAALPPRASRVLVAGTAALGLLSPLSPGVPLHGGVQVAAVLLVAVLVVGAATPDPAPRSNVPRHGHQWS